MEAKRLAEAAKVAKNIGKFNFKENFCQFKFTLFTYRAKYVQNGRSKSRRDYDKIGCEVQERISARGATSIAFLLIFTPYIF